MPTRQPCGNLGWVRRKAPGQLGFVLDVERGYWSRNEQDFEDLDDPLSSHRMRVIPYVEDRKNCLLLETSEALDAGTLASVQAALKVAIQVEYELEESELAVERLPSEDEPRLLLFYEASEGGAGVLRRLIEEPHALGRVAERALRLCHFDPATGEDRRRAERAKEDCEAACYDCLLSYQNQRDHKILDRHKAKDILTLLMNATVETSPTAAPRAVQLEQLLRLCQSDLERSWLQFLDERNLRLPSKAQAFFEPCSTRPDFLYEDLQTAIYVDGPHHEYPDRKERDRAQTVCMEDHGWTVIRFDHEDDWEAIVSRYPHIFGGGA